MIFSYGLKDNFAFLMNESCCNCKGLYENEVQALLTVTFFLRKKNQCGMKND